MKTALEGLELAEKICEGILKYFLLYYAAEAALGAGHGDSALDFIQRGISEGEKVGHPLGLAVLRLTLAKALLRAGRVEESMEPAEAALKFFQALDMGTFLRSALEIYAEILANWIPKDEMQIDQMMERAAALVERSGSPWDKIEHLEALARISLKRGRLANARKSLIEARSLYREVGLEDVTEELRSIEEALEKGEEKGGPGVR
jgi:tetratricopeptide (TPR) repeat protein